MKNFRLLALCLVLCMSLAVFASAYTANLYKEDGTLIQTITFEKGVNAKIKESQSSTETRYFLGYGTADGKQMHMDNIHTEQEGNLELTAKYATRRDMVPGENFIQNGTFEEDFITMMPSNGSLAIVTEKDGNRVLQYSRASNYASIQHYTKWEPGRKYRVSYRYMIPEGKTVKCTINARYWETKEEVAEYESGKYKPGDHSIVGMASTPGVWKTHSADITLKDQLVYDYRLNAFSLYCEPINPEGSEDRMGVVYYDDIQLIPFHKITYNPNGGTISGTSVDYQLNGTYSVKGSIVPVREGYAFLGWGRTQSASANVSEIELNGEDIELYARWMEADNQPVFMYNFANDTRGNADGAMSFVARDKAEGYTSVTLYYGDAKGILKGYTPLKTLKLVDGVATYGIDGKRAFPIDATKIYIVFSAEGKEDYTYIYDIPADKLINDGKEPILSFYSISDVHNGPSQTGDYNLDGRYVTYTRENAIRDMFANKDNYAFVLMNGDNVCHSKAAHYARFQTMLDRFKEEGIPTFFGTGNHEFHVSIDGKETPKLEGGDEEVFLQMLDAHEIYLESMGYTLDREAEGWSYSFEANGIKFIMVATPYPNYEMDGCDYSISGEQLKWLERELFEAEQSNKPVFVLTHVGISKYIPPYTGSGLTNVNELEEVLNRHANLFFGTAHSHTNINVDWHTVVAGNQTTQYTHYNEGSVAYTSEYDENFKYLGYETDYSIGYFIDIYDDRVVFRGRMFDDVEDGDSKFISHATYQIMMPGADKDLPELSISGEMKNGSVLTPSFSKNYDGKIKSYEWYMDGKVISTDASYKVDVNADTCGKYLACRVTYEDGTYVSALSEKIPGYVVTYDYNGGTGPVVPDQDVVPNAEFTPVTLSKDPSKTGMYFVGWSVNKDATEADASFKADGNMTLYAVYKEGYTITYNLNGGTGNVPATHVVPKNETFMPAIAGGFPMNVGKYFVGWADTKDAAEPMASVYAKGDMTLYAVFSDEPKWYFNANLSGFVPNTNVTSYSIEDGKLVYSNKGAAGKDLVFQHSTTNFLAEDYPIVRVKLYGTNANGEGSDRVFDSIFFTTETAKPNEKTTKIPLWYVYKVAEADGMYILEIKINERDTTSAYTGTIKAVRFDALSSSGVDGYTDYLVFTDKLGIFKADVTVTENNGSITTTLSEATVNCTADAVIEKTILGETIIVTLTPADGYEFTTAEDVMALTTINGEKPDSAIVLKDGSAVICKSEKKTITVGETDETSPVATVKIDKTLENKDFVIALYSDGVLCGLQTVTDASASAGYIDVVADSTLKADTVRIFAFDSLNSITPACEPFEGFFN